ncbi:MAG: chromate efflux transporter [Taibaiella sp.]|nr:chromate efflux transporter [Taibaiella sp.]
MDNQQAPGGLKEVALYFFKLGVIGFGGPAVHIAMMEKELVEKRKWLTREHFLDLIGATNLIPGPNSTEMTMHCGHVRAGWKGLVVAGSCFIIPAVIITSIFAWAYATYGQLPEVEPFIYGIQPVVIGIILSALINLAQKAVKSVTLGIAGMVALVLCLAGINEIAVLFGMGFAGIMYHLLQKKQSNVQNILLAVPVTNAKLFWIFLKVGSILYGSGYVLFAFLDAELVSTGILTRSQLIDAIAVGQFTPGPVFSAATFVGWQINGWHGALVATAGIFLPSFLFVALLNPLIPRLRKSAIMSAFLDMVNVAAVALILSVCIDMGKAAITDWRTILIAIAGFITAFFFKHVNAAFIILGGALGGYLLSLL